jgi:lipid II:glycine glycyltransferase (peptidoglycan interpeptide bridge formation enzyme)
MVRYYKKFYFFTIYDNWFEYCGKFSFIVGCNAFWHIKQPVKGFLPAVKNITHTVELDITQKEEDIFASFSKQIRQQYRIAETEGTTVEKTADIDGFVDFFNEFAVKKNTHLVSVRRIVELGEHINLFFAKNNGVIVAASSFLTDRNTGMVRHYHASTKRLDENFDKNLIGRANKYLIAKAILYYKEQGYTTFDFGGYSPNTTDPSLIGINNFKMLFGGKVVPCTNYFTYGYWLLKKVSKLLGMSGKV